jgi:hypothetical protein
MPHRVGVQPSSLLTTSTDGPLARVTSLAACRPLPIRRSHPRIPFPEPAVFVERDNHHLAHGVFLSRRGRFFIAGAGSTPRMRMARNRASVTSFSSCATLRVISRSAFRRFTCRLPSRHSGAHTLRAQLPSAQSVRALSRRRARSGVRSPLARMRNRGSWLRWQGGARWLWFQW